MIGEKYGRLLVVEEVAQSKGCRRFNCLCDCGTRKVIFRGNLLRGYTRSCGCLNQEERTKRHTHGQTRNGRYTPEYRAWRQMLRRVRAKTGKNFRWYGARGITVCERWMRFEKFFSDMGKRPTGRTLDRVDNNGNYEPGNCRWATPYQQGHNKSLAQNNRSGIKGVCWNSRSKRWIAQICLKGSPTYLGCFVRKEDAARAYETALQLSGDAPPRAR
jgi:hypothetical protein